MKTLLILCSIHAMSVLATQPSHDPSPLPLFDGSSTEHWRGYNRQDMPQGWVIQDGCLHRQEVGGDIITRQEFGDFELRLEWKIAPGGNSGIMYRVSEGDPAPYFSGPEYQVLDNSKHRDGQDPKTSAGALYGLYAAHATAAKPAGEWNRAKIVVVGNHVEHWLNEVKVVDCEMWSDDWAARFKKSKFASWAKFARNRRGHIALQDHGDPVWYRNVTVLELAAPPVHDQEESPGQ